MGQKGVEKGGGAKSRRYATVGTGARGGPAGQQSIQERFWDRVMSRITSARWRVHDFWKKG